MQVEPISNAGRYTYRWRTRSDCRKRLFWLQRAAQVTLMIMPWPKVLTGSTKRRWYTGRAGKTDRKWSWPHWHGWTGTTIVGCLSGSAISHLLKQKKPITLPSGKRIWQPEFPDLTLSHKTGTVQFTTLNADKPDEEAITVRQSKYLNDLIEQDHRNIKRRIWPMLGFSSFRRAQTILAGIELIHMIRKGQYQHPQSEGLSPAEQFYLLVPK